MGRPERRITIVNVSVVIPAYNAASTIAETLQSLIAQTFQGWEAIVVDDGSTDATCERVRESGARDARIKIVSRHNGGESAARNTGIGLAKYDWLHFLDADDWIAPTCLERFTAKLAANPELDAVHCRGVRVARDGTLVGDDYVAPIGDLFPTLARRVAFPVHACVVRKSLVEAVGKFDTTLKTSPDWDLWQRIARGGARFGALDEVLVYYRMNANSSSLDADQLFSDILTVLRRGHSRDPRVPNPLPEYAEGWQGATVESQVFYLLSWCAGLLIGHGQDARRLFEAVKNDRYVELSPQGIAESVFGAAILPSCQPPSVWEKLWPEIHQLADKFLVALEEQSGTPDLARRAMLELKKLILKHSTTWAPVIEEGEQAAEALGIERNSLQEDLSRAERERLFLAAELSQWKRLTRERESALAELHTRAWIRLGSRLKLVQAPEPAIEGIRGHEEREFLTKTGELRTSAGSIARLLLPSDNPEVVRIGIEGIAARAPWDIQWNFPRVSVKANQRYAVHFRARADKPRIAMLGFSKNYEPWTTLGLYREIHLTSNWQDFQEDFLAIANDENGRIHFDLGDQDAAVEIAAVRLSLFPEPRSSSDGRYLVAARS